VEFHCPARYAHQLLFQTVDSLATGPGDVRARLLIAYEIFHPLTPEHFPEHLRKDFEWVDAQLTKNEPRLNYQGLVQKGSVQVSLERMRNSSGVKIAETLLRLHYAIDAYVNPR
jgi:hypothetical protein